MALLDKKSKDKTEDKTSDLEKRFREVLCKKIVDIDEDAVVLVDFCKLPGYKIAREGNEWLKKINQHVKKKDNVWIENLNSHVIKKYEEYNADVHLVESCTRHLMRKKAETVLGDAEFILTCYGGQYLCKICKDDGRHSVLSKTDDESKLECVVCRNSYAVDSLKLENQVLRFGKPMNEDYMIYFMVENSNSKYAPPIIDKLRKTVKEFENFKKEKKNIFDNIESSHSIEDNDWEDLKKSLQEEVLQKIFEINEDYVVYDDKKEKKPYPIRWTAWAVNSGRYRHTYTKSSRENEMVLTTSDQREHILDALTRNLMRDDLHPFFGSVFYTLSVFEKLARISMRLDDHNTLFVTLDKEISGEKPLLYTTDIITRLDKFLKKDFEKRILDTISIT